MRWSGTGRYRDRLVSRPILLLVALVLVAGCTKEAPERSEGIVERRNGRYGTPVEAFGISVNVLAVEPFEQSPAAFPRLRATVRSENTEFVATENPSMRLRCEESEIPGDWFLGSTWEPEGYLAPGAVSEGRVVLAFPPRTTGSRYPVPGCTDARLEVIVRNRLDRRNQVIIGYEVEPEIIREAIFAPRGPALPLPPRAT